MPGRGEVIGESMVRERALIEVWGSGCVEGGRMGAEISIELRGMHYRAILITGSMARCRTRMIEVGLIASCRAYWVLLGWRHLVAKWSHEYSWIVYQGWLLLLLECI